MTTRQLPSEVRKASAADLLQQVMRDHPMLSREQAVEMLRELGEAASP